MGRRDTPGRKQFQDCSVNTLRYGRGGKVLAKLLSAPSVPTNPTSNSAVSGPPRPRTARSTTARSTTAPYRRCHLKLDGANPVPTHVERRASGIWPICRGVATEGEFGVSSAGGCGDEANPDSLDRTSTSSRPAFTLFTPPSQVPELHVRVRPLVTASRSRFSPLTKECRAGEFIRCEPGDPPVPEREPLHLLDERSPRAGNDVTDEPTDPQPDQHLLTGHGGISDLPFVAVMDPTGQSAAPRTSPRRLPHCSRRSVRGWPAGLGAVDEAIRGRWFDRVRPQSLCRQAGARLRQTMATKILEV
jgi:hypothetical protein